MTAYYCDLAADFADRSGVDHVGNGYTGPGGLRAALMGTGLATALAAGDILYLKDTAHLTRLVLLDIDRDVSGWGIGDTVRNDNDAGGSPGDDWTGKVVEVNYQSNNDQVLIQLDSPGDEDDVNTADGIENTSAGGGGSDPTDADIDSKACTGIIWDGASGDTVTGAIHVIGCDASWVARADQAVLDGDGDATNCLSLRSGGSHLAHVHFKNLTLQNATSHNFTPNSRNADYLHCRRVKSVSAGSDGWYGVYTSYSRFIQCAFDNNTADGIDFIVTGNHYHYCRFVGNGGWGFQECYSQTLLNKCLIHDNASGGVVFSSHCNTLLNCVLDGTDGSGNGVFISTDDVGQTILACRICNHAAYGIDKTTANDESSFEDWNVFDSNTSGDLNQITSGRHSYGDGANHIANPGDDGYDAAGDDFNVVDGKELRSTEIDLYWDA